MTNLIKINNKEIPVKEYKNLRVVTFKEIDEVHGRTDGTARRNYYKNKEHFSEGEDYFVRNSYEARSEFGVVAPQGLILLTESGYLMIAKSLTDDKAWEVQRQLIKSYFKLKEVTQQNQLQFRLPSNYKEALLELVGQVEENEKLQSKVLYLEPKAESFDTFISATGNLTIEETAKTLNIKGVGRNKLFQILVDEGILFKKGSGELSHYEAYQQYVNSEYFVHKQNAFKKGLEVIKRTQVFVTPKGLNWLSKKVKQLSA